MLIFNFFAILFNLHSPVLKNQFPISVSILCGCGCGWTTWALCIGQTCSAFLNILIHSYINQQEKALSHTECSCTDESVNLVHLLSTRNASQIITPPWCNSQVSLPCSPLCSNSHTKYKVNKLDLPMSYITPYNTLDPHPSCYFQFLWKYKSMQTFCRSLIYWIYKPYSCITYNHHSGSQSKHRIQV